ncbi:MAG: DUF1624 domain-containing protein [Planctomycetia bacterium]|nr:DUF1624 domain-containing protein [Planctomycetia bacterium]
MHSRLHSIDLLRGLVMILMALDHVRDFFFTHTIDPTDLSQTTPSLFFTRWISHFCAPTFLLLAGVGAALSRLRGKSSSELASFLITRGLWLIFLEWCVVRTFGWAWNFDFTYLPCWVIWTLGWSMILLGLLVRLPTWLPATLGAILILGHHLADPIKSADFGAWGWLWTFLHDPGEVQSFGITFSAGYPLIPWVGVMMVGYGLGMCYAWEAWERRILLVVLGIFCVVLFLLLRASGLYGEGNTWIAQSTITGNVISFLNCTKQPPSLCYLLMTLGPVLLLLAWWDAGTGNWSKPFIIFGKVPMFFYLLHLPLIHGLCLLAAWWQTGAFPGWLFTNPPLGDMPASFGFPLWVSYLVWLLVVLALYPLCVWYAGVKQRNKSVWLSYL